MNATASRLCVDRPVWIGTPKTLLYHSDHWQGWSRETALKKFVFFDSSAAMPEPTEHYYGGSSVWYLYPNDVVLEVIIGGEHDGDFTIYRQTVRG